MQIYWIETMITKVLTGKSSPAASSAISGDKFRPNRKPKTKFLNWLPKFLKRNYLFAGISSGAEEWRMKRRRWVFIGEEGRQSDPVKNWNSSRNWIWFSLDNSSILIEIMMRLEVLDFLEKTLLWLVEKFAQDRSLNFRVLSEIGFLPAPVFPAFLPRLVGSPCVLGLKLKVWIFPTSLLWTARPNSPPMSLNFGREQKP